MAEKDLLNVLDTSLVLQNVFYKSQEQEVANVALLLLLLALSKHLFLLLAGELKLSLSLGLTLSLQLSLFFKLTLAALLSLLELLLSFSAGFFKLLFAFLTCKSDLLFPALLLCKHFGFSLGSGFSDSFLLGLNGCLNTSALFSCGLLSRLSLLLSGASRVFLDCLLVFAKLKALDWSGSRLVDC